LFEDGKEAVFFSTNTELVAKVDFYLRHPEERRCIAAAGKKRCVDSGYSNYERMKLMLGQLSESMSP
jgi:spore maturation protein CgeB